MSDHQIPQLGQFVKVLRGREYGKIAVIVGLVNDRFVLIADGDKRKFDQPKKKNLIHLQILDYRSSEVADSLLQSGRVTNGKLRYALGRYMESQDTEEAHEKGE